jgi:hypothetical protein
MKYLKKFESFRVDENFFKNLFKSKPKEFEARIEGERERNALLTLFDLPVIDPYKMTPIPPEQIPVHCKNCKRPFYLAPGLSRGQMYSSADEQAKAFYGTKCPGCKTKIGFKVEYTKDRPDTSPFRYNRDVYYLNPSSSDKEVIDLLPDGVSWVEEIIGKDRHKYKEDGDIPREDIPKEDIPKEEEKVKEEPKEEKPTKQISYDLDKLFYLFAFGNTEKCPNGKIWDPINKKCIDKVEIIKVMKLPTYQPVEAYIIEQLYHMIQKSMRPFVDAYSKSLSTKSENKKLEINTKLQTLERELKTKNLVRIKDAIRIWFGFITPILSLSNKKVWLESSDGRKWGKDLGKFEMYMELIKDYGTNWSVKK